MKVFLDVGAHLGETLNAVRDPKYAFDRIYCFEPARACRAALDAVDDDRVAICSFGLWNRTCKAPLYGAGSIGASIFEEKGGTGSEAETSSFVRATEWFRANLERGDRIFLKLNCEGAEFDIVEDLLDSGELGRLHSVMIDPDVRKVPSRAHREHEVRERLKAAGMTNYVMEEDVMVGSTHRARIQNWLRTAGAEERSAATGARQLLFVVSEALHGRRAPLREALRVG